MPEIFNIHQRKAAALAYLNKQKARTDWAAGASLMEALTTLSEGNPLELESALAAKAALAAEAAPAAEAAAAAAPAPPPAAA